jgi:Terminase large subunit, T4likevirus-type, N-terminal
MSATELGYNPDQQPTLARFHKDNSYFRLVRGPAGSGKTYGAAWEVLLRALAQPPAPDGVRYTRALVVRNTFPMLRTATIPTFKNSIGPLFRFVEHPLPEAKCRHALPDGTVLDCHIIFRSFDDEESARNSLGAEFTFCLIDEVSEFSETIVLDIIRRAGRYPSGSKGKPLWYGVWAAMNGPPEDHWTYQWEQGQRKDLFDEISKLMPQGTFFKAFAQPPALLPPDGDWASKPIDIKAWRPNPAAENVTNLPGGYGDYYAMLTNSVNKIRAYVLGEYSPLVVGTRVFPEFNPALHQIEMPAEPPRNWPLYIGFDFGRTPVAVIALATPGGRLVVTDEIKLENAAVSTLAQDHLLPLLRDKYKHNPLEGAWGDPAGSIDTQAVETSPFQVLWAEGIPVDDPGGANRLDPRLEAVKQALTRLDQEGRPQLQVDTGCVDLTHALLVGYVYEKVRGHTKDVPTKSHVRWVSDLSDALQYLCLGYFAEVSAKAKRPKMAKRTPRWL